MSIILTMVVNKYKLYALLMGLCFVYWILPNAIVLICGKTATGRVVEVIEVREVTRKGRTTYHNAAVISFFAEDKEYYFTAHYLLSSNFYVGAIPEVIYNRFHPSHARLNSFWGLWLSSFLYFIPSFVIVSGLLLSTNFVPRQFNFPPKNKNWKRRLWG